MWVRIADKLKVALTKYLFCLADEDELLDEDDEDSPRMETGKCKEKLFWI
jgi:hypothetical protein